MFDLCHDECGYPARTLVEVYFFFSFFHFFLVFSFFILSLYSFITIFLSFSFVFFFFSSFPFCLVVLLDSMLIIDIKAHVLLGDVLLEMRRPEIAEESFKKAINLDPTNKGLIDYINGSKKEASRILSLYYFYLLFFCWLWLLQPHLNSLVSHSQNQYPANQNQKKRKRERRTPMFFFFLIIL